MPGATASEVRSALASSDCSAIVELLSPEYRDARRSAARLVQALALPDVGERGGVQRDTTRQEALAAEPGLVAQLVDWFETVKSDADCLVLCRCLRSLCVSAKSATAVAPALPRLLVVIESGGHDAVQAAVGCLLALSIWCAHLVAAHGGVRPLLKVVDGTDAVARLAAVRALSEIAAVNAVAVLDGAKRLLELSLDKSDRKVRAAALATLARLSERGAQCLGRLLGRPETTSVLLAALKSDEPFIEPGLILLANFLRCRVPGQTGDVPGTTSWARDLAERAAPAVAFALDEARAESVRAVAADCVAIGYTRDCDRRLLALGPRREDDDSRDDNFESLGPGDYVHLVYHGLDDKPHRVHRKLAIAETDVTPDAARSAPARAPAQRLRVGDASVRATIRHGRYLEWGTSTKELRRVDCADLVDCVEAPDDDLAFVVSTKRVRQEFITIPDKRSNGDVRARWLDELRWAKRSSKVAPQEDVNAHAVVRVTPRRWEDAVWSRREALRRRNEHPDVLGWLFAMVQTSTLARRGLDALLNLCSDPDVNRHVREFYDGDLAGLTTKPSDANVARKLELLTLAGQIEAVEDKLASVDLSSRRTFRLVVLEWRRYLGYKALSVVKDQFDKETLGKLQETFAEIDVDGSGSISLDELQAFFRVKLKMPLSQKDVADIIKEVDMDGNGVIDFEEFLLVVRNVSTVSKIQSRLGVALAKSSMLGDVMGTLTASKKKQREKMRNAFQDTRFLKQTMRDDAVETSAAQFWEESLGYRLCRHDMTRRWDVAATATYAAAKEASIRGRVTLDSAFRALGDDRGLVEGLGFVYEDRRMYRNTTADDRKLSRRLRAAYDKALDRSQSYDVLCACADEAGLDIRADISMYGDFETSLWLLIRAFRREDARLDEKFRLERQASAAAPSSQRRL